jgi:thiol-disulfide isomerase/thioredoxin
MNGLLFAALLLIGTPVFCAELAVGSVAPEIQAKLLDGGKSFLLSSNRGKVTLINFWATWCGPCKAEMPLLQAYYDQHKAEGFEMLAISMDENRDLAEVRKIAQKYSFPIALKSEANFKGLGRIWRMPSTFVIDRDGIIRKNGQVGDAEISDAELSSQVTPLIEIK